MSKLGPFRDCWREGLQLKGERLDKVTSTGGGKPLPFKHFFSNAEITFGA
jgi:hypothetical protein